MKVVKRSTTSARDSEASTKASNLDLRMGSIVFLKRQENSSSKTLPQPRVLVVSRDRDTNRNPGHVWKAKECPQGVPDSVSLISLATYGDCPSASLLSVPNEVLRDRIALSCEQSRLSG